MTGPSGPRGCARRALAQLFFVGWIGIIPAPLEARIQESTTVQTAHERALEAIRGGNPRIAIDLLLELDRATLVAHGPLALLLGTLLRADGDLDAACRLFRASLDGVGATESTHLLWFELAVTRSWMDELAQAEIAFREAVKSGPDFLPSRLGLARVLRWRGKHRAAEENYRRASEMDPRSIEAWNGLGFTALAQLDGVGAKRFFETSLRIEPQNDDARSGLSRMNEAQRVSLAWHASRSTTEGEEGGVRGAGVLRYRLTPSLSAHIGLQWAPRAPELFEGTPSSDSAALDWSAEVGASEQVSASLGVSASATRIRRGGRSGLLVSAQSGMWVDPRRILTVGIRGGRLPDGLTNGAAWLGFAHIWDGGRNLAVTVFGGSDFRDARSLTVQFSAGASLGDRLSARATGARGWTSGVHSWQSTADARYRLSGGREVTIGTFLFRGAYSDFGIRLGARLSL